MVPGAGLEPARFSARDFKSLVSTNSTTRAQNGGGYQNRTGVHGFAIRCITTLPTRHFVNDNDITINDFKINTNRIWSG